LTELNASQGSGKDGRVFRNVNKRLFIVFSRYKLLSQWANLRRKGYSAYCSVPR